MQEGVKKIFSKKRNAASRERLAARVGLFETEWAYGRLRRARTDTAGYRHCHGIVKLRLQLRKCSIAVSVISVAAAQTDLAAVVDRMLAIPADVDGRASGSVTGVFTG